MDIILCYHDNKLLEYGTDTKILFIMYWNNILSCINED
jgi:hypothetical protein